MFKDSFLTADSFHLLTRHFKIFAQTLMKASTLDAANARRKECVNSLRREKMAEVKGHKRLVAELERARAICASTTRATQQVLSTSRRSVPMPPPKKK